MKQKFLMENVINCGYDPTEFAQFMEYKMGKYLVKKTKTLFNNLTLLSIYVSRGWN